MTDALRTDRLRLDPWAPEHGPLLAEWSAHPEVVRYVGDGAPWSPQRAADRSASQLEHWRRHGFGWRIAVADAPVGLFALNFAPEGTQGLATSEYEIGWWLAPAAWGHGYAREGAAAVRDEAFGRLGAPSVVARISPANARSIAVAEAIGLRHDFDTVADPGLPVAVYRGER